jgi:poly(A) polymerase
VGGMEDLEAGRIRVIGDPAVRFVRDPVRMLRVLRHAARTGFSIGQETWEEIQKKAFLIRTCPPARVRDEILKDFRSGAAQPFFKLMLDSGLFYAIFPAWSSRLGAAGAARLLELAGRLDRMALADMAPGDSLLWAVFLTAYLEPEPHPQDFKELRDFIHEKIREALGGIEFPRQRHDEVSQMLALEERVTPYLKKNQPIPARLARLSLFPATILLYQIKAAPEDELLERVQPENLPAQITPPKARRSRRRHRGGRRRRPPGAEG